MSGNRGAHPNDEVLFGPDQRSHLRAAVRDLSWLRSRGYSGPAAQALVGDRYRLKRRQRNAVGRSSCTDAERAHRLAARMQPGAVAGHDLLVDGFNVLITVEALLGGAFLFVGRDTAYRDINPIRGTYRVVRQTAPALQVLADVLQDLGPGRVRWHLDRSVSNVGRVKERLGAVAEERGLGWDVEVSDAVDSTLAATPAPVVTSDSAILEEADAWLPLEALVHQRHVPAAHVVDLRPDGERSSLFPCPELS